MSNYDLLCTHCGKKNDERETTTYCTVCDHPLFVHYHKASEHIQYPLNHCPDDPLKTYTTELRRLQRLSAIYDADIWAKLELQNPTGCFKDRGSFVEVLKALELGAEAMCLASTGNMAASVAAYSRYFGIPCFVFVPDKTPEGKLAQAMIFGANIIRIEGDFSDCETLCRKFAKTGRYYLAGDYVFREEGQKSFSFELIAQGGTDFDFVSVPVGCGTNFGAIWKGFLEAKQAGKVHHLPRMVAVQPTDACPVVEGLEKGKKVVKNQVQTIATAVAAADPIDFIKVQKGIRESHGLFFSVSEEEILTSLREMAWKEGIFTEPACALPLAALKQNHADFKGKKVLFVLTGTGLKDTGVVAKYSLSSPPLPADLNKVEEYIHSGFPEIQHRAWGKGRDALSLSLKLDSRQTKAFERYRRQSVKKGKHLSNRELEVLQTLALSEINELHYPIRVLDYEVRLRKNGLVTAKLSLDVEGDHVSVKGKGVGPMDAALTAIKSVSDGLIPTSLLNHQVEIIKPETNSLVLVTLTLENGSHRFETREASTDVLEAALLAFTKGLAIIGKRIRDQASAS